MEEKRNEKIEKLAEEVLRISRNILIVNLRFMDSAISNLKSTADENELSLSVDGQQIRYNPVFVLRSYQKEKGLVVRQYLHMILHCVFQHAFVETIREQNYWDLACDIAVENVINELELPGVEISETIMQQAVIKNLKQHVKYMTAEVLYRYFMEDNVPDEEMEKLKELFGQDDHGGWYTWAEEEESGEKSSVTDEKGEDQKEEKASGQERTLQKNSGSGLCSKRRNQTQNDSSNSKEKQQKGYIEFSPEEMRKMWKDVSQQMQLDLETFSKERGSFAGGLTQNLMAVNRETYDYSSFLKKFAVLGESVKINDDEFDYIFYTYGLQMYGRMPLVEPLEYKEVKKIKEFVIALDTSGSTSHELVQKFVQKTYNILKQQENFFTKINLHIIQCDAEIQEDAKITSQEEFDEYLEHMQIRGLAGTDFRPVFSYVDYLIEKHEFTNLRGLIYFTDGFGVFPKKQPSYQTAIVYLDEGYENPQVPVWAIKLVLKPEEI